MPGLATACSSYVPAADANEWLLDEEKDLGKKTEDGDSSFFVGIGIDVPSLSKPATTGCETLLTMGILPDDITQTVGFHCVCSTAPLPEVFSATRTSLVLCVLSMDFFFQPLRDFWFGTACFLIRDCVIFGLGLRGFWFGVGSG